MKEMKDQEKIHPCCEHKHRPVFKEPLFLVLMILAVFFGIHLILISQGIGILTPVFLKFSSYLGKTWWAILLGLMIGGLIDVLVPEQFIAGLLAYGRKSIVLAVILGFFASACSHGILAIAVSLYKKGASTAATMAFLLAAPWANLAITLLLFSLFGVKALFIVGGALLTAVVCGFIFQYLEQKGIIEGRKQQELSSATVSWVWPGWKKLTKGIFASVWILSKTVVWWVLLGFLLASFLGTYLPEDIFHRFFGPSFLGLLATLVLASVIEVCSEGSAPMAFELFEKTRAFGNAFAFLQAGVITDFTEIGVIATNIGRKAALALVLVGTPFILLLGFLFNKIIVA